jgi:hypothetical protein
MTLVFPISNSADLSAQSNKRRQNRSKASTAQLQAKSHPIGSKHHHRNPIQRLGYSPVGPRDDADLALELPHLRQVQQQHRVRLGYE